MEFSVIHCDVNCKRIISINLCRIFASHFFNIAHNRKGHDFFPNETNVSDVYSLLSMSPSSTGLLSGIPWQITSFTDLKRQEFAERAEKRCGSRRKVLVWERRFLFQVGETGVWSFAQHIHQNPATTWTWTNHRVDSVLIKVVLSRGHIMITLPAQEKRLIEHLRATWFREVVIIQRWRITVSVYASLKYGKADCVFANQTLNLPSIDRKYALSASKQNKPTSWTSWSISSVVTPTAIAWAAMSKTSLPSWSTKHFKLRSKCVLLWNHRVAWPCSTP